MNYLNPTKREVAICATGVLNADSVDVLWIEETTSTSPYFFARVRAWKGDLALDLQAAFVKRGERDEVAFLDFHNSPWTFSREGRDVDHDEGYEAFGYV